MYWRQIKITLFILTLAPFLIWVQAWIFSICLIAVAGLFFYTPTYLRLIRVWFPLPKLVKRAFHWSAVIISSTLVVFFVKTYVVDIFRLPSTSMQPETQSGDIIVINKLLMGPRINVNNSNGYRRAWGYSHMQHNDLIIFNFPEGDTTLKSLPTESYYALKRTNGANGLNAELQSQKQFNRVAHRTRYIKRVIGMPGDTIEIKSSQVYVNLKLTKPTVHFLAKYVATDSIAADSALSTVKIEPFARFPYRRQMIYEMDAASFDNLPMLANFLQPFSLAPNLPDPNVFPHTFLWNSDNMGPMVVPAKGQTIELSTKTIDLYKRIINTYEGNELKINGNKIFINNIESTHYTFKMNYYWVMGDNQPHSFDSRYWGFLPENHIIGISRTQLHF